ncbi:hypothetical protein ACFOSC_26600 [Streptantibioticus rubrisoli]
MSGRTKWIAVWLFAMNLFGLYRWRAGGHTWTASLIDFGAFFGLTVAVTAWRTYLDRHPEVMERARAKRAARLQEHYGHSGRPTPAVATGAGGLAGEGEGLGEQKPGAGSQQQ